MAEDWRRDWERAVTTARRHPAYDAWGVRCGTILAADVAIHLLTEKIIELNQEVLDGKEAVRKAALSLERH